MKHINHKGFSLLEILLTITLLSILFAILVTTVKPRNIVFISEDNRKEADALTIYQALEKYALKNNNYPEAIKNMPNNSSLYICKTSAPSCINSFGSNKINLSSILVPIYMSKIPEYSTDTNNSGFYVVKDSNGKIGIGGVRRLDDTTFVKGLESQSFATVPFYITCNNPITSGLLAWGVPANGVTISIPYVASGQTYSQQTLESTGITGLTATLSGGTFSNGSGNLIFNITGTPSGVGAVNFSSNINNTPCSFAANSITPPIVSNGLVLHLDAGNPASYPGTGTNWFDLSGNGNNGTLVNGVGFNSANGGSLVFDGVNDRVSTTFKPSGARSYFIWIKYNTVNSLPNGYSLTGTQQANAYNYLGIKNGGAFYYYAGTSGGTIDSTILSANIWYQQGFVLFSDGSRKLYLNGVEISSQSGGLGVTATSEFSIGCVNQQHWIKGSIPIVTQYNRALTPAEIQQNFNATRGRFDL